MNKKDILRRLEEVMENSKWSATVGDEAVKLENGVQEIISDIRKEISNNP
jgi:hypothetical protein